MYRKFDPNSEETKVGNGAENALCAALSGANITALRTSEVYGTLSGSDGKMYDFFHMQQEKGDVFCGDMDRPVKIEVKSSYYDDSVCLKKKQRDNTKAELLFSVQFNKLNGSYFDPRLFDMDEVREFLSGAEDSKGRSKMKKEGYQVLVTALPKRSVEPLAEGWDNVVEWIKGYIERTNQAK